MLAKNLQNFRAAEGFAPRSLYLQHSNKYFIYYKILPSSLKLKRLFLILSIATGLLSEFGFVQKKPKVSLSLSPNMRIKIKTINVL